MLRSILALLVLGFVGLTPLAARGETPDAAARSAEMFGELRLIDEVIPGQEQERHAFAESEPGVSAVRDILGRPTRVIPNTGEAARYVAYRLGAGMGLEAGRRYVLRVEYPEDAPRTMFIHNRGGETARGLHTGPTVGDALHGKYVDPNAESLQYPLSGAHEPFEMLFTLHDRYPDTKAPRGDSHPRSVTPKDGVPVIISQWKARNGPLSEGAAFSRIALYEVVDPSALALELRYPPADLPRRHLFWREEMSDGVVGRGENGVDNAIDWYRYKADLMRFLGMNTYTIDMLEFGHNQGWDSGPGGGNKWVNQSHDPQRWEKVLRMLKSGGYDFTVLPYYEYAGSVGSESPGTRKYARPLGDAEAFTHITWSEKAYADVTEPVIVEDAKKVLDLTINRWAELMPFTGAWFRTRPSHIPVSFSDNALAKFSREAMDGRKVTREQLRERGPLYDRYVAWWNDQRKAFFVTLRDHLREHAGDDAMIFFTADASEGGVALRGAGRQVVTDDVAGWNRLVKEKGLDSKPVPFKRVVAENQHLKAQLDPHPTWGQWEWEHSVPRPDPANLADTEGVIYTYTFNKLYTVSSPKAFDAFRTPSGLGIVRHYCLNENEMEEALGYFVMDVERTGAHVMHAEVLAMAHGDPWYIGYLAGHQFNRGFPYYARRFNRAYLSLPALPSEVLPGASSTPDVVVRAIRTEGHGTWLAVANTDWNPKAEVTITLPPEVAEGAVTDAATGEALQAPGGRLTLSMDAAELRAIHVR